MNRTLVERQIDSAIDQLQDAQVADPGDAALAISTALFFLRGAKEQLAMTDEPEQELSIPYNTNGGYGCV